MAAKPRVIDFAKSVVVSLSPTLAGREAAEIEALLLGDCR